MIFFLLIQGDNWRCSDFYPVLNYSRHITKFLQLLLSNKLRCSVPFKFKVFELIIVQYCSLMIIAAWIM